MNGRTGAILILTCITWCSAPAQPDGPARPARGIPIDFVGAALFPGGAPNEQRIDCFIRVPRFALVAVRGSEPSDPPFIRRGELTIECADSTGAVAGRAIEQILLPESDPIDEGAPLAWIERGISITVPRGNYTVNFELIDLQSRNRVLRNVKTRPSPAGRTHAELAFFYRSETPGLARGLAPDTLRPQNLGSGVEFSAAGGGVVALTGLPDSVRSVDLRFRFIRESDRGAPPVIEGTSASLPLRGVPILLAGPDPRYLPGRSEGNTRFLAFPLPLEKLPLRRFTFEATIIAGKEEIALSAPLMTVWPDQPESLRDIDGALEVLRYVVTEHELDSLTSGNREERIEHLEKFWKRKDPTPATADNPIMAEFYRRVDHARTSFATLKVKDGVKTDRGKIYLLQGPPTRIDRKLDPSRGFTETWSYERTGKQFIFRDVSRDGSYLLVRQ